jgi:tubulin polyglutamylase TTLL4
MFQDGLVRLATQQYSTNQKCLKKRFIHLTNYSVNKKAENYNKNTNENKAPGEKAGKEGNDNNNE